jgi:hypothetical protein
MHITVITGITKKGRICSQVVDVTPRGPGDYTPTPESVQIMRGLPQDRRLQCKK